MIADLKILWQEAFDDPDDFIDLFFSKIYTPDRCHCIQENGGPVSALYWFDCDLKGRKLAYVYAVATLKSHRGQGLAQKLIHETHEILRQQGYAGVILVPAGEKLFGFYKNLGYEAATTCSWLTCQAGDSPRQIQKISPVEYARLLPAFLPEGGVVPGEGMLRFLDGYCQFYAGADFLMICEETKNGFKAQEFLGNTQAAPGILKALGFAEGRFHAPGKDRDFAMWLPLEADCPKPGWFGPALN